MSWPDIAFDQRRHQQPRTVAAAMLTEVKLSGIGTTVGEVRALFADEHVHCAAIVCGGILIAIVDRTDVHDAYPDEMAAVAAGCCDGRVVCPTTDLRDALELMLRTGRRRLAVVETDGTFLGLLCLKRTRRGFCSDRDVQARSRASRAEGPRARQG